MVTSDDPRPTASASPSLGEALAIVQQQALFLKDGERIDRAQFDTSDQLKVFLAARDFYSDYLTRAQFDRLKQSQRPRYFGIGMEIQRSASDEILCYPVPSGPAAAAGIKAGDRLLTVDGVEATGQSLPGIVGIASGDAGTEVRLGVATSDGSRRSVAIRRVEVTAPAVSRERRDGVTVIRVPSFTQNTRSDLEFMLSTVPASTVVVIDLRANTGGDFYGSIDAAMLFLAHGAPVVSVRSRRGIARYVNTRERRNISRCVVLWQDEMTASAAEVFVAALTGNRRAKSVGWRSFGKGTRQDVFELLDGGALILTTGRLQTPGGIEFEGKGLLPDIDVGRRGGTEEYLRKTARLIAACRSVRPNRMPS
ncbi:MAG: S41 family peptidase [Burkholderiaceae bacterium]